MGAPTRFIIQLHQRSLVSLNGPVYQRIPTGPSTALYTGSVNAVDISRSYQRYKHGNPVGVSLGVEDFFNTGKNSHIVERLTYLSIKLILRCLEMEHIYNVIWLHLNQEFCTQIYVDNKATAHLLAWGHSKRWQIISIEWSNELWIQSPCAYPHINIWSHHCRRNKSLTVFVCRRNLQIYMVTEHVTWFCYLRNCLQWIMAKSKEIRWMKTI